MSNAGRKRKQGVVRTPSGQPSRAGLGSPASAACVYIMASQDAGHIKIGMSRRPAARLDAILTSNPTRMFLYRVWPLGYELSKKLEFECHKRLKGQNVHIAREWYRMSADVAERFVEAVAADLAINTRSEAA